MEKLILPARVESDTVFDFLPEKAIEVLKNTKASWHTIKHYSAADYVLPNTRAIKSGDLLFFGMSKYNMPRLIFAAHLLALCKADIGYGYFIHAEITENGLVLTSYNGKSRSLLKWREFDWRDLDKFVMYEVKHWDD